MSDDTRSPIDPAATRAALLAAGAELFAEHGYAATRVRDIAARAGANLAAISYHFGGKQELYTAVLEHEAARMIAQHPLSQPDHADDPVAQLRDVIGGLLGRVLADDERGLIQRLLLREMFSPSEALPLLVERVQKPQFALVLSAVTAVAGPHVPPERLRLAGLSLVAQCLFYLSARPVVERIVPDVVSTGARTRLIEHLTDYNLAALQALRAAHAEPGDA
ncbi:MAG: CerR family C-terminal domain-containing protein [Sinimarinibacterium flocculans]|uniref:CerR family C-terminal domain-containing protein n=1 Tax=Sinimarinibacterium flocculans TaxID=985250 RepID=UPI003C5CE189